MIIKKIILTAMVGIFIASGNANAGQYGKDGSQGEKYDRRLENAATEKVKGNVIKVDVKGLVCDFCAYSIRRVFMKTGAAKKVDVNLKRKSVIIHLKEEKDMTDKKVKKLLRDAGYTTVSISRYGKGAAE